MSDALQFLASVRFPDLGDLDFTLWRHLLMMVWLGIGIAVAAVCVRYTGAVRNKPAAVPDRRKIPRVLRQEGIERVREDLWWYLFALRQVKRYLPPSEVAKLPASLRLKKYRMPGRFTGYIRIRCRRRTQARRSDAILIELERRITARKLKQTGGTVYREPVVMTTRAWSKRAVVVEK